MLFFSSNAVKTCHLWATVFGLIKEVAALESIMYVSVFKLALQVA